MWKLAFFSCTYYLKPESKASTKGWHNLLIYKAIFSEMESATRIPLSQKTALRPQYWHSLLALKSSIRVKAYLSDSIKEPILLLPVFFNF